MLIKPIKISDIKKHQGELVRALRKREKMSQQELADVLALSRITIQNLEAGKNFTIDTFLKVLQYFDVLKEFNHFIIDLKENTEDTNSLY